VGLALLAPSVLAQPSHTAPSDAGTTAAPATKAEPPANATPSDCRAHGIYVAPVAGIMRGLDGPRQVTPALGLSAGYRYDACGSDDLVAMQLRVGLFGEAHDQGLQVRSAGVELEATWALAGSLVRLGPRVAITRGPTLEDPFKKQIFYTVGARARYRFAFVGVDIVHGASYGSADAGLSHNFLAVDGGLSWEPRTRKGQIVTAATFVGSVLLVALAVGLVVTAAR
jgi:hypothetical protein